MTILRRFKRLVVTRSNKAIMKYEDKIDCLKYELNKKSRKYEKVNNNLIDIRGQKKLQENKIAKSEDIINQLDSASKKALREEKDDLAKEAYDRMKINKNKLEIYKTNFEALVQAEETLSKQVDIFKKSIEKTKSDIETLEIKNQFSKNIEKINESLKIDLSGINNDEITKLQDEIDKEYYVAEIKAENIEKSSENELEDFMTDDDFEQYKKSVLSD